MPSSTFVPELKLLHPLDPALLGEAYEDDWPQFMLRNAIVTDRDGNLANLFHAASDRLLVVSGELRPRKAQAQYYVNKMKHVATHVEVETVGRYAFGTATDGSVIIWASGKAGWWELNPALEYAEVYAVMEEMVRAWYFVLDSPRMHDEPAKTVFAAYAKTPYAKQRKFSVGLAGSLFTKNAAFMLDQMRKDGPEWTTRPIYGYLESCLKGDQQSARRNSETIRAPAGNTESTPAQLTEQPTETGRKRGRPKGQTKAPAPKTKQSQKATPKEEPISGVAKEVEDLKRIEMDAGILWKFIERTSEKTIKPSKMTVERLSQLLHNEFMFDNTLHSSNYIKFQAENLLNYMQERRRRRDWEDTQLHEELVDCHLMPQVRGRLAKTHLRTREYLLAEELAVGGVELYASSDEEVIPKASKSVLRPRSGKRSGKRGKSYTARQQDSDEESESTPLKRKAAQVDGAGRLRKRRAVSPGQSTEASSRREASEEPPAAGPAGKALPLRWKNATARNANQEDAPIHIVQGPEFDTAPNAPGDVWNCPASGCVWVAFGASTELGLELIEEHVEMHQNEMGENELEEPVQQGPHMNVVMREMMSTHLPASNLMKRIREFAAAKELAGDIAAADTATNMGPPKPAPIRKLFT